MRIDKSEFRDFFKLPSPTVFPILLSLPPLFVERSRVTTPIWTDPSRLEEMMYNSNPHVPALAPPRVLNVELKTGGRPSPTSIVSDRRK
jgi:hypothetical protein